MQERTKVQEYGCRAPMEYCNPITGIDFDDELPLAVLMSGTHPRARLVDMPDPPLGKTYSERGMRRKARKYLQLKLRSDWVNFPIIYHWDLPENAVILNISVYFRVLPVNRKRWFAAFTYKLGRARSAAQEPVVEYVDVNAWGRRS